MKSSGNPSLVVTRVPSGPRIDSIRAAAMSKFVNLLSHSTNLVRALLIVFLGSALALLSACGGGSSNTGGGGNPPAISVALSSPPTSVQAGATAMLTAVVSNDSANGGVNWSCAPASACGSFNPTQTASGTATTYTAPTTAPTGGSVTVTATSVTDSTKTASATITISSATGIAVAIANPPTSLAPSANAQLTATVTNDSSNGGVTWSCTPTGLCGSFNPTQTASGSATTYTAPGTAPTGGSVIVTATSVTDTTKTATATITISSSGGGSTSLAAGTYVLYATGLDSAKHVFGLAGEVQLDGNGNVTAGEQDFNDANGINSANVTADTISGGTYTTNATGQGTMTLTTSNTKLGVNGTETLSITVVNSKHVLVTQFDSGATSSGSLDLQTLAATGLTQLVGSWSFEDIGENNSASYSQGGVFTLSAPSQTGTCSTITPPCSPLTHIATDFDEISGGVRTVTLADGSGSGYFTAPDQFGRGQAFFGGIYWNYYIVGPEVMRLLGYYPQTGTFDQLYVGSAYGQGTATYSAGSFHGPFVFTDTGSALSTTYAAAGQITFDGTSAVTGFADVSEGTATPTSAAFAGSYQMNIGVSYNNQAATATNGYGRITITPGSTQDVSVIGMYAVDPALNISDPNNTTTSGPGALLVDLDSKLDGAGVLLTQGSTSGVAAGNYAVGAQVFSATSGEADLVGQAAANSSAVFTGTVDVNDFAFNTGQNPAAPFSVTLAADGSHPGRFTAPLSLTLGGNAQSFTLAFYQVSATQFVMVVSGTGASGTGTIQSQ